MHYKVIFDVTQNSPDWSQAAFGLIFVTTGLVLILFPQLNKKSTIQRTRIFGGIYLAGALLWTAATTAAIFSGQEQARAIIEHHQYKTVEGRVKNFLPMMTGGRKQESFDVGDEHFAYSDYVVTPGFRKTATHGGPIKEGLPVRISYADPNTFGHQILRLEVGDE